MEWAESSPNAGQKRQEALPLPANRQGDAEPWLLIDPNSLTRLANERDRLESARDLGRVRVIIISDQQLHCLSARSLWLRAKDGQAFGFHRDLKGGNFMGL